MKNATYYTIGFLALRGVGLLRSGIRHRRGDWDKHEQDDSFFDNWQFRDSFRTKGGYNSWWVNVLIVVGFASGLTTAVWYALPLVMR